MSQQRWGDEQEKGRGGAGGEEEQEISPQQRWGGRARGPCSNYNE